MFIEESTAYRIPQTALPQAAEGDFLKQVLVIAVLEPGELGRRAFLERILAAADMDLYKDTLSALIQPKEYTGLSAFLKTKQPRAVLVFGATPTNLGVQAAFSFYQPTSFYGTTFLWADSLAVLEGNNVLKRRLWVALQTMFLSPQNS